jgi:hypothetical protein
MYKTLKKPINLFGNNNYAYVTYIYGDNIENKFVSSIVLAQSLINTGSKADRVVMISRNVNEEYKFVLNKLFNHIIEIDLIKIKSWKLTMKNKEYNTLFTKYQALNLSNYKKIILIEPNFVILQNPDYLFSLNAPAGLSLKNKSYINTKLLLLEPKLNEFDSIILDITNGINKMKVQEEYSHPDGEYMYKRYDNWKNIGPEFSYLKNKLEKYEHINFIYYDILPSNMNIIDIEINDI